MIKKLISLISLSCLIILCFFLVSCDSSNKKLIEYKETAKAELQTYVSRRGTYAYSKDNQEVINNAYKSGLAKIDEAKDKAEVDKIKAETMLEIDNVSFLSRIEPETRLEIDRLYLKWFKYDSTDNLMECYYGKYNGFYIFSFYDGWFSISDTTINGLTFHNRNFQGILAVKEEFGGTLEEIYENGYITRSDLEKIYEMNVELNGLK